MKNLVPFVISRLRTQDDTPLALEKFIFSEELVVACFCGDGAAAVMLWSPAKSWHDLVEWPLSDETDRVVGLHYDSVDRKAVAALSGGDFVEIRDGEATVVGSLDTSLSNCEWSPSGDLAVVVCESGKILMLSTDFDLGSDVVVGEHQMSDDDLQLAEAHVSVGWGKKETQFRGRGARAGEIDPTLSLERESRELDPNNDDLRTTVSWRGDGTAVAVNSPHGGQRAVRIFNAEGKLEGVSEAASQLLAPCAYEPRGMLIATVRSNGLLQFFERNGLKRYTFAIDDAGHVKDLSWSSDSTVLSILYDNKVELWTQKNWHWYRKQVIMGAYTSLVWHPELPKTLGLLADGELTFSTWQFSTASDQGLVAVVDTNELKVTPLSIAGVPPPMAFASVKFESQPKAVAVRSPATVAVSFESHVALYHLDVDNATLQEKASFPTRGVQLLSFDGPQLIGYDFNLGDIVNLETRATLAHPEAPVSVLRGSYYMCGNRLFRLGSAQQVAEFVEPCTDFVAAETEYFGLTRSGKLLHSSGKTISLGVTSILRGPEHLLYTTMTTLRFVHFGAESETQLGAAAEGEQTREIERGSQLVTIMSEQMAVTLQAPRGNLETIYPRMLVLGIVRACVSNMKYREAFEACKVHRLDMNLLHDLDPQQWRSSIDTFVSQLGSNANLDLFLSALSNEDVTKTKYVDTSKRRVEQNQGAGAGAGASVAGKANSIIDEILPHIPTACQITALAMKQPPALVEALEKASGSPELIKHLVYLSDSDYLYRVALGVYKPKLALSVAQQAQMDPKEYLPFLRARNAESEPRSRFNIDVFLKRTDRALGHLLSDPEASDDEITAFVLKHSLHVEALRLLRQTQATATRRNAYRNILRSQAEQFDHKSRYLEAGTNYELLGEYDLACECYVVGCYWKRALALPEGEDRSRWALYPLLADMCASNKHFADAAHIYLNFLQDYPQAITMYCQADMFDDAIMVANLQPEFREHLDAKLRESFGVFQELLSDCSEQVPAQLKRLREVRAKRQEDSLGFEKLANQLEATGLDAADTFSLAGTEVSGASAYTRYTDKSSSGTVDTNASRRTMKNQRRQDRKRARGKKGSVYEEDYLISSTARLVERVAGSRSQLQELVVALRRRDLEVYATNLTSAYEKVVRLIEESLDEIYAVDNEALLRFDESGHEYIAERPVKPVAPKLLD